MHSISGSSMAGKIGARAGGDVEAGAAEQIDGRVFELPLGMPSLSFTICSRRRGRIVGARFRLSTHSPPSSGGRSSFRSRCGRRRAERFDFDQQRVVVAIGGDFLHDQAMPGAFALHPKLVARAAVEGDEAGFDGLAEGFLVHEADHEDAAREA
jgi:hypothetical protein